MKRISNNQSGFTLVELVSLLVVLGILMGIAIPNYSQWVENYKISAESQKLYLDLMLARSSAVKNNNNVIFTFEPGNNRYRIHNDTNENGVEDPGEGVKVVNLDPKVAYGINGTVLDMDGNTISSAVFLGGGGSSIIFDSRGQASTSGSAYLIPVNDLGAQNDRVRAVSVIAATGSVDIWKYDGSASPTPWS
ncbi:MAG: GspH/FimT family pseudopilin [Nitrospinaceae bacterium]